MSEGFSIGAVLRRRYRLQCLIGRGGMASVYRARDELLQRDVAVKIFQASAVDQASISRQESEVRVLASLNHHNVVTLLDAGVDLTDPEQPHLYLVMELIEGTDLKRRLAQGFLSSRQVAEIGFDLAEGLEYIQHRGVVHRDIKPANIMLAEYGGVRPRAKLTDFGIALLSGGERVTNDGATTGTAAYLSPEQAQGHSLTPASDMYSLGLVLLECLTGRVAFPGDPVQSAIARLLRDPEIPATLAPAWRELLTAMTARKPSDRPHVRDVIVALRQIVVEEIGRHKVDPRLLAVDEASRMAAVRRYDILDTPPDGAFDRITALAARLFSAPIAIVSVVDHDRIWFKSHHGLEVQEIGRDAGLCASAILQEKPWVIENAPLDIRSLANPLVAGEFGLKFYAGMPLRTNDGHNLGTICVLDFEPRSISPEELQSLEDLAAMVMSELELRLATRRLLEKVPDGFGETAPLPAALTAQWEPAGPA